MVPSEGHEEDLSQASLIWQVPSSPCVLAWSSLCVCEDTSCIGSGPTLMTSFSLNHSCAVLGLRTSAYGVLKGHSLARHGELRRLGGGAQKGTTSAGLRSHAGPEQHPKAALWRGLSPCLALWGGPGWGMWGERLEGAEPSHSCLYILTLGYPMFQQEGPGVSVVKTVLSTVCTQRHVESRAVGPNSSSHAF